MKPYDLAVIGAGPGGYVAALRAAQLGMLAAVVDDREHPGGTCLNIGCIPSKALLESSELYAVASLRLGEHGIRTGDISLDLQAMLERKNRIVLQLVKGVGSLLKRNGVDLVRGRGFLKNPETGLIGVQSQQGEDELRAQRVLLATGSEPAVLPGLPFDGELVISSTEAISLSSAPGNMVVVGAGAIGLELGSVWARLGCRVTVVEITGTVLPGWDGRLARSLQRNLQEQGLRFMFRSRVTGAEKTREGLAVRVEREESGEKATLPADRVLVAVGRKPRHREAGIEDAGVETDRGGFIRVDRDYRTAGGEVYAVGDVIGGPMLAHKAQDEGIACVERMSGIPGRVRYDTVPNVIYTAPEAASVGATEEQLLKEGIAFRRGSFPFKANGRALAMGSTEGTARVLAHQKTGKVLGVHVVGPQASTLIAEAVAVMEYGGSAEDIARIVHAHPTLPEAVREAALDAEGRAIHAVSRTRTGPGPGNRAHHEEDAP